MDERAITARMGVAVPRRPGRGRFAGSRRAGDHQNLIFCNDTGIRCGVREPGSDNG